MVDQMLGALPALLEVVKRSADTRYEAAIPSTPQNLVVKFMMIKVLFFEPPLVDHTSQ